MRQMIAIVGFLGLAACASVEISPDLVPRVETPFDEAAARQVFDPGTATVGGRVTTDTTPGPSATVRLITVTPYSTEVMESLFQGSKIYFKQKQLANPDARYPRSMRYTTADRMGSYNLEDVPAGEYFVYATVADRLSGATFAAYERIEVSEGQSLRINLDGV